MWKTPYAKSIIILIRIILASTKSDGWILAPFCGSGTTGIAVNLLGRKFLGIDENIAYLKISEARKKEIDNIENVAMYKNRIEDLKFTVSNQCVSEKPPIYDSIEIAFQKNSLKNETFPLR